LHGQLDGLLGTLAPQSGSIIRCENHVSFSHSSIRRILGPFAAFCKPCATALAPDSLASAFAHRW
jgi:hypothetical protein